MLVNVIVCTVLPGNRLLLDDQRASVTGHRGERRVQRGRDGFTIPLDGLCFVTCPKHFY